MQQSTTLEVLQFALLLEYLEADFYERGMNTVGLIPSADRAVFGVIAEHEAIHVNVLRSLISGASATPIAKPEFDYTAGGALAGFNFLPTQYETFKALAMAFEDTGVRAYKGQAANLMSNSAILEAALRIHSVEARHASRIRRMRRAAAGAPTSVRYSGTVRGGDAAAAGATDAGPQAAAVTAVLNRIYGAGANATTAPSESNTTHAGINVTTLTGASFGLEAAQEAFDEPLDRADVVAIVQPFFIPTIQ